jgi:plastocyanin
VSPGKVVGALAAVTVAAFLLVACGDDSADDGSELGAGGGGGSPDAGSSAGTSLTIEAHDIDFDRDAYRIAAGSVDIEYVQEGALPHSLVLEASDGGDVDGFKLEVGRVDADSGTVDLPAGDYVIYCDVPGHRDAGMEARLQVD